MKLIKCKFTNKKSKDIENKSGVLTRYSRDTLNKPFDWNDWEIIEVEDKETLDCPLCSWKTVDIENKSGWFTTHLERKHNLSPEQFCNQYPEYKHLWDLYWKRLEKKKFLNESEDNYLICKICNKKLTKITNSHLQTHGITGPEYREKYGIDNLSSLTTRKKLMGDPKPKKVSSRKLDHTPVICQICGEEHKVHNFRNHLQFYHKEYNTEKYVKEFGEFRPKKLKYIESNKDSSIRCAVCNQKLPSNRLLMFHIKKHDIHWEDYIVKYIFNGVWPTCSCGCGQKVKLIKHGKNDKGEPTYARSVISGHNKKFKI